ncbi:glycosyltransferase [Pedobacter immunditicola]|uniref:glycosyltransferase n=1 Tax=Pedobacter immunditicola TaxID=3133440 RepID=UPI0030AB41B1
MTIIDQKDSSLVSIIIPCFNQGKYLLNALESIWSQNYADVEIIVVDDGSTDNTKDILKEHIEVKYIHQQNAGPSAARNKGILSSKGAYLIFLDADDWLLPKAIETNMSYLLWNNELAFVSGAHEKVFVDSNDTVDVVKQINADHYIHLLCGNYIGMHATVMFRRWVFDHVLYDDSLRACEDYDLYFNITKRFPVFHHTHKIAAYRIHQTNTSGNIPLILNSALKVLHKQKKDLHTLQEKRAYHTGQRSFKNYYGSLLYNQLVNQKIAVTIPRFLTLARYCPFRSFKLFIKILFKNQMRLKSILKEKTPGFCKRWMHEAGVFKSYNPAIGEVYTGDFNRLSPFSTKFGYDRGGPIDRYYIEKFLKQEADHIKGRTLEIGDNEYSLLFGQNRISKSDILHINDTNPKASFIGDLSNAPQIPENTFDCIILTQTLHLIYDFKAALATCQRILKPDGVLLLTTPGITPIDHETWESTWYWSFTDKALTRLISETFPGDIAKIESFGNVFIASAFLYGMGVNEVAVDQLNFHDPHFQVTVTAKVIKNPAKWN